MELPVKIKTTLARNYQESIQYDLELHSPVSVLIGPNASGKTQILRSLKKAIKGQFGNLKIKFVASGRLGPIEQHRLDYEGNLNESIGYEKAAYGNSDLNNFRHTSESIKGAALTLSKCPDILIKITERLRVILNRELKLEWKNGILKLNLQRIDDNSSPYASAREASGLLHLVAILASLYDPEINCLLIDEPEISLHPQLQSFLFREIKKHAGNIKNNKKIIIISTHSTEFIDIKTTQDLCSLIFCEDYSKIPLQISPNLEILNSKNIKSFLLKIGHEHKAAFFCKRPVIIEGPSDNLVITAIINKISDKIDSLDFHLIPALGKPQIPIFLKILKLVGKEPVVLGDADIFVDEQVIINHFTNSSSAISAANSIGHKDAKSLISSVRKDFIDAVSSNWSSIESKAIQQSYLKKENVNDLDKRRAAFCALLTNDISDDYWNTLKKRLIASLNLLEKSGCFILTKGTIENYYQSEPLTDKLTWAFEETLVIESMTYEAICDVYHPIVACLNYAAYKSVKIDETRAIRDLILKYAPVAIVKLKENPSITEESLNYILNENDMNTLFSFGVEKDTTTNLLINLKSTILEPDGFPLKLPIDCHVINEINRQMNISF
ncbi:AAA family ATPase [Legionella pneumophila serogroup 1]